MGGDGDFTALRGRLMKSCCCSPLGAQLGEADCPYPLSPSCPLAVGRLVGNQEGLPFPAQDEQSLVLRPYPSQGLAPPLQSSPAEKMLFIKKGDNTL